MNSDRIYVADMWTSSASIKGRGLRPYYIKDGKLHAILVSRCRNRWGKIFLLTTEEAEQAQKNADIILKMRENLDRQRELYTELLESTIVHNIIPQ